MAEDKTTVKQVTTKKAEFRVAEVEPQSVIVLAQGWRKRAYFDGKKDIREGQMLEIEYTGDLENIHTVEFLKLK